MLSSSNSIEFQEGNILISVASKFRDLMKITYWRIFILMVKIKFQGTLV